jgi:leucyl-tRNA synthetase
VRDRFTVDSTISEEEAKNVALASEKVKPYLAGKTSTSVLYVKGRLISISF